MAEKLLGAVFETGVQEYDASHIAHETLAFGKPVAFEGDKKVKAWTGSSMAFFGFTMRDDLKKDEQYAAGDTVLVMKKGGIIVQIGSNKSVTKGKRAKLLEGSGTIVDETDAGAGTVIDGSLFLESGSNMALVKLELNLP